MDVFAAGEKNSGNAVAIITHRGEMNDINITQIIKELHFPESAVLNVQKANNNGYAIRFFTSNEEIPYSGLACLGAAYIIKKVYETGSQEKICLNLKKGPIYIDIETPKNLTTNPDSNENFWIEHDIPTFGDIYNKVLLSNILGLDLEDDFDDQYPIQEVFSGLPFIIVPVKNLRTIKEIEFNKERYYWLIKKTQAKAILVFCRETEHKNNHLHVRVFADYYGIPEDSATGSGNGCLAAYLLKYTALFQTMNELRIEQGYEIKRPSLVLIRAHPNDNYQIHVGGKVHLFAKGEFV